MKILSIIGARPQFVKAAVFRKYCDENGVEEILLHTGQHYDPEMSTKIFEELDVRKPDISHKLAARSHGGMTGEILEHVEKTIIDTKPDFVNVYGDTNSTLAGALAASKLHLPVIHIEAGLRSFNKKMPEEINRILTDHMSDYLFCPTTDAVKNLNAENITNGVYHVGDIMYDAVKIFADKFYLPNKIQMQRGKKLAVMTVHRADTTSDAKLLQKVMSFCNSYSGEYQVIFPVHPNTRNKLKEFSIETGEIELVSPVSYLEMQGLLKKAKLVLTDSGGLQKEAYFHRCDCITLREETEWVETVNAGWNMLWTSKRQNTHKSEIGEYGDGNVCRKIIKNIKER
ncbi:UDP-N-acetylglucosamine 2-epimerase (non-hydrolyzing) [Paracoccaceae bacterium]|nr:UDP-N-acetylglucosamine 2-epimerase (non-hydrolyzing) [Paracoccaceae bacterium]